MGMSTAGKDIHGEHNAAEHHFASFQIDLPELVIRAGLEKFLCGLPDTVIRQKESSGWSIPQTNISSFRR